MQIVLYLFFSRSHQTRPYISLTTTHQHIHCKCNFWSVLFKCPLCSGRCAQIGLERPKTPSYTRNRAASSPNAARLGSASCGHTINHHTRANTNPQKLAAYSENVAVGHSPPIPREHMFLCIQCWMAASVWRSIKTTSTTLCTTNAK